MDEGSHVCSNDTNEEADGGNEGYLDTNFTCPSLDNKNSENKVNVYNATEVELSQSTPETCSNTSQNLNDSDHSSSECLESENAENLILSCSSVNDLDLLREQNKKLQTEILKLEKENARLEADRCPELHELQLETLEKTIFLQKQEIKRFQDSLKQQSEISQKQITQMKQEYDLKLERLTKQYEIAKREKESMVMKYAVSEKAVIDLKKEIQLYDNKIKESNKDKEASEAKLKTISTEKSKLKQLIEAKNLEIISLERENSKRKDEINMRDSKIKWAQSRLKIEVDNHAETQLKLEKLQQKFYEAKEEAEQYKRHTQALIKNYQEAQEDKTNQEQEQKAKLIIDKYDEESAAKLQVELDTIKKRQSNLIEENNCLTSKIQSLEKQRFEHEQNLTKMKQCMDSQNQVVVDLQSQLVEFESVSLLLQQERENLAASQAEIENLRLQNSEMQQDVESCKNREAELLEFTQKLTEKNVQLQTQFLTIEARAQQLDIEHSSCTDQISQLRNENVNIKEELEREKMQRRLEGELLNKHLEEETKKVETLTQELADQQGENQLLKKKHLVTLKELTKELQMCRKKLEGYENSQGSMLVDGSRTSSNTSLNIVEINENKIPTAQPSPTTVSTFPAEPDRQLLIDKIVKIQKSNARKTEKIEFLEEHVRQLVTELQKKTRIIQNYITREQSGALSSEMMDHNKPSDRTSKRKVALSKHGGIMASVYNSKPVDEGMTLELSLEINQKLQAVLEDTLLKNITLKENMETLGNEIAKLTANKQSQVE